MTNTCCPGCPSGMKGPGKYLCLSCWHGLPMAARRALSRRDSRAIGRVQDLYRQLGDSIPFAEVVITEPSEATP